MSSTSSNTIGFIALGVDKLHGRDCIDIVTSALEAGYRIIDTAQSYGNEEEVGDALARSRISRSEIFVTTKISRGFENPRSIEEAYDSALDSIHKLRLSYVDLFLIHSPGNDVGARSATWLALEQLVREGLVKDIGVSNYGVQHILEMKEYATIYPPKVNQIELHPWCQQRDIEEFCASQRIRLQAFCPLVRNQKAADPNLCRLAAQYAKSTQQVLTRYSLQKGWTPILSSSNAIHLRENMDVNDFVIRSEDIELLDSWNENDDGAVLRRLIAKR